MYKLNTPSNEMLRHWSEVEHRTPDEIAQILGWHDSSVRELYHKRGLSWYRVPLANDHLRAIPLNAEQRQVILGAVLGDGTLHRNYYVSHTRESRSSVCFVMLHGEDQKEYLEWKKQKLEPFITSGTPLYSPSMGGYGKVIRGRYSYRSITHPDFKVLRETFYPNGIKIIPRTVLDELQPLGIAIWLMDDGCFAKQTDYIRIATNAFTRDDLEMTAEWFKKYLSKSPYVHSAGQRGQLCLNFNRKAANELREIVLPYFYEPLRYKLGLPSP